jgi:hypothetical protein
MGWAFDRPYLSWQSDGAKIWLRLDWAGLDCGRSSEKASKKERKSIVDSLIPAHFAEKLITTDTF